MTLDHLDKVLDQVDALPPAPQILPKLLRLLADPDTDVSQVTDLIAFDPGLTAKVLQLCNSAWLASSTPATDISEAVGRLGMKCVYRLVAAANGQRALRPTQPVKGFDPQALWKHSVITALAAQFMAQDAHEDESITFTAALLHDAGKVVLAQAYKEAYGALLLENANGASVAEIADLEAERFGANHATAGGRLLAKWQFPEAMVAGVAFHHRPAEAGAWQRLAAHVHLAEALAGFMELPPDTPHTPAETVVPDALALANMSPDDLLHYRDRTLENFEFVNAMCRL
jgi:putative nucleotidyltransferase with HDIG domain